MLFKLRKNGSFKNCSLKCSSKTLFWNLNFLEEYKIKTQNHTLHKMCSLHKIGVSYINVSFTVNTFHKALLPSNVSFASLLVHLNTFVYYLIQLISMVNHLVHLQISTDTDSVHIVSIELVSSFQIIFYILSYLS